MGLRSLLPALLGLAAAASALPACSSRFAPGDIGQTLRNRDGSWFDGANGFDLYAGYGSPCSYPYARAYFPVGNTTGVRAPLGGLVARIEPCVIAGSNDKIVFHFVIGYRGSSPVYLELGLEPMGGKLCSAADSNKSYFESWHFLNEGVRVSQGDHLAQFTALGAGAHVSFRLHVDGAIVCPEIFSEATVSGMAAQMQTTTCGTEAMPTGTLCQGLTTSEDPARLR